MTNTCAKYRFMHLEHIINSITCVQISLSKSLSAHSCLQVFRDYYEEMLDQLFSMSPVGRTKGKSLNVSRGFRCK